MPATVVPALLAGRLVLSLLTTVACAAFVRAGAAGERAEAGVPELC